MISFAILRDESLQPGVSRLLNDITRSYLFKAGAQTVFESPDLEEIKKWYLRSPSGWLLVVRTGTFLVNPEFVDRLADWYSGVSEQSQYCREDLSQNVFIYKIGPLAPNTFFPVKHGPLTLNTGDLSFFKELNPRVIQDADISTTSFGSYSFLPGAYITDAMKWFMIESNAGDIRSSMNQSYRAHVHNGVASLVDENLWAAHSGVKTVPTRIKPDGTISVEQMVDERIREQRPFRIGTYHSTLDVLGTMLVLKRNRFDPTTQIIRWNQNRYKSRDDVILNWTGDSFRDIDIYMTYIGIPENEFFRKYLWGVTMEKFGGEYEFFTFLKFFRSLNMVFPTDKLHEASSDSLFTSDDVYLNMGDVMCSPSAHNRLNSRIRDTSFQNILNSARNSKFPCTIEGYDPDGRHFVWYR